jgi:ABC-2 type transport system ATP-binding protein
MSAIAVSGLVRRYGRVVALAGIDFTIQRGEIVGLLGRNGAGKTTAMKILTGFVAPTEGRASVLGHDVVDDPVSVRRQVGYLPENAPLWEEMTVRDVLDFGGRVHGLGTSERARAIDRAAAECDIADRLEWRVGTLSRGYRQRTGLALALLHEPPILILDEPTTGLDPSQIAEIRALIRRVGKTRTVILSTHILPEVQVTCDRVIIVHQGRIVADGATETVVTGGEGYSLTLGLGQRKVVVRPDAVSDELAAIEGVTSVRIATPIDEAARFRVDANRDVREAVWNWATERGHLVLELSTRREALEDAFRRLTGGPEA